MTISCQASVLHGAGDLRIEQRQLPALLDDEVEVTVASTGLCGSDLHYYKHFRNGDILVREPLSLGHESSGVVSCIGANVTDLKLGDRVALEVGVPCGSCDRCSQGRYNICRAVRFRSSGKSFPHFQGTLQERINHPAAWCHKLPENISLEVGALLEPLGVALHAFRRSQMSPEANVLVFGAGAVGLLCAAVAKMKGANQVVVVDIDSGRLDFALEHGFAHKALAVSARAGQNIEESFAISKQTAEKLCDLGGLEGFDVVLECTGTPSCVQAGIYACRAGGRLMLVGMGHPTQTLPLAAAALREVDILGVFRYANTYPESIDLVRSALHTPESPDFAKLVTHRFHGLSSAPAAFEMAGKTKDASGRLVLKVVIENEMAPITDG